MNAVQQERVAGWFQDARFHDLRKTLRAGLVSWRDPDGCYAFERRPLPSFRPDLAKYVNSTRYALTWDDVYHRETTGRPYPKA